MHTNIVIRGNHSLHIRCVLCIEIVVLGQLNPLSPGVRFRIVLVIVDQIVVIRDCNRDHFEGFQLDANHVVHFLSSSVVDGTA